MPSLDQQFQQACDAGDLPGVVLLASDTTGKFKYEKAFGLKSPGEKIDINATFILASCTKLMTTIAAMQCVERGEIKLDDDVSTILTELKGIQILTGFKEETNEPLLTIAKNKITLRHKEHYLPPGVEARSAPAISDDDQARRKEEVRRRRAIGSATDFLKILTSLCASSTSVLLKPATIDEMFTPQLALSGQRALTLYNAALAETKTFTSRKSSTKLNFGLGGLLVLSDDETGLKAGTMTWSGLPNLLWTIDRGSG
ncbi:hypothetical protein VE04_08000, partial [Pseudogymnoascus sp. 24MN13]